MRRRTGNKFLAAWLLSLFFGLGSLLRADDPLLDDTEPPLRLKKKNKRDQDRAADQKPAAPDRKGEPKKDNEAGKNCQTTKDARPKKDTKAKKLAAKKPGQGAEARRQLIQGMLKKMRTVEDRLAKNNPGRGTRAIQREILDDLDKLIETTRQQPPSQGGGSRRRQSSQQQKNANRQNSRRPKGGKQPRGGNQQNQSRPGGKPQRSGSAARQPGRGGLGAPKRDKNNLADLFKDVWGHYPETMRMEMEAYSRAKFIPKYRALLRQYYRTLAEDGRRKQGD